MKGADTTINTEMLIDKINSKGLKYGYIASVLGITRESLKQKVRGTREFKSSEISKLCKLLDISTMQELKIIFFN